jgi:hypothetical protein
MLEQGVGRSSVHVVIILPSPFFFTSSFPRRRESLYAFDGAAEKQEQERFTPARE